MSARGERTTACPPIAIVGMACCYPDARSPEELWQNVLAQRRAFRKIPFERLHPADYFASDRTVPDSVYSFEAAVIEGYAFDRVRYKVSGSTFRATDLTHWLALDVATEAMANAGFPEGEGLPRETTGVLIGNTLTGEFSRAALLRLRWPYARRVIDAGLRSTDWDADRRKAFLDALEHAYKAPFPEVNGDTLAGGLSNTISGRICNAYDFKGGGYTVDGACSSSLLAVANACTQLVAGDLDVVLAGGVDLSLDPFELVGFAKAGALAADEMRVYDARSAGFWPGEGCGVVVLMRLADAIRDGRHVQAVIRGWGISSDGSGGMTRPEEDGQRLALRRAYARAGVGVESVGYFEGHGTGTPIGDAVELRMLSNARREAGARHVAALGSIKGNIGHTKAAAGAAGLIKAALALREAVIPPTTGVHDPHPELCGERPALRVTRSGTPWPSDVEPRAGVSSMGFGGINVHIVLEAAGSKPRARTNGSSVAALGPERSSSHRSLSPIEETLVRSPQDAELFLFAADRASELASEIARVGEIAARLSRSELTDLAAALARRLRSGSHRAAVVAGDPSSLADRLAEAARRVATDPVPTSLDAGAGVFVSANSAPARIGFLFPGQGSPSYTNGGALRRRFARADALYAEVAEDAPDETWTAVAQPSIVRASLATLRVLADAGIEACAAIGHSLGEITALSWGGAFSEAATLRLAAARGAAMAGVEGPRGAMAALAASEEEAERFLTGEPVVVSALNTARQVVLSGEADALARVVDRARRAGIAATPLRVSHAFHSPLMAGARAPLRAAVAAEDAGPLSRTVMSTVTGERLERAADIGELLERQLTNPVRFERAFEALARTVDLLIEIGPGDVLTRLVAGLGSVPAIATDAGGSSLQGTLAAVGAAYVLGAPVRHEALFADRFVRPFDLDRRPTFFGNPCELAPSTEGAWAAAKEKSEHTPSVSEPGASALAVLRALVAERAELPAAVIRDDAHLLEDLHLNSITVAHLVADAAARLGLRAPADPTEFAGATLAGAARALETLRESAPRVAVEVGPAGVENWVRAFLPAWRDEALPVALPETPLDLDVLSARGDRLADALRQLDVERVSQGDAEPQASRGAAPERARRVVVVCLPATGADEVELLLEGARRVRAAGPGTTFALVQRGESATGFARTLHEETDGLATCVISVPPEEVAAEPGAAHAGGADGGLSHAALARVIARELERATGCHEVRFTPDGKRQTRVLRLLSSDGVHARTPSIDLTGADVLLVTGGGKGIAAECALDLARQTGVRLALLGRSDPRSDRELAANLERFVGAGVTMRYERADVSDAGAVVRAIREVESALGPVTAVLHGAGSNQPKLVRDLDAASFHATFAPKVRGLENVLAALDAERLRLLVAFGSIIARTGLRGEADYALANGRLTQRLEAFARAHAACRCLAVEWSIWSGVGMGERLGRVEALSREGIRAISPDRGVAVLRDLLCVELPSVAVIVSARFGETPLLPMEVGSDDGRLPLWRFLERPRVHYPGLELVTEADLSATADPYLVDHALNGVPVLPGVVSLEAMAQAAMAVTGAVSAPWFRDVVFERAITVPAAEARTIRVAALVRSGGEVDVVVRSSETGFAADHARATCIFLDAPAALVRASTSVNGNGSRGGISITPNPERELYGGILFQTGRFQRLRSYDALSALACSAVVASDGDVPWFGRFLSPALALGDPGIRDAGLHAIQACVPHRRVLPVAVEEIAVRGPMGRESVSAKAREVRRDAGGYVFDLDYVTGKGDVIETWRGLRLVAIDETPAKACLRTSLLAPFIERSLHEILPQAEIHVGVAREGPGATSVDLLSEIGVAPPIGRRADGKLEIEGGRSASATHGAHLSLAVVGASPVSCDLEPVQARPADAWLRVLGPERMDLVRFVARTTGEGEAAAATRVWTATECLKKAGLSGDPLVFDRIERQGWVTFRAGRALIASALVAPTDVDQEIVVTILGPA